MGLLQRFNFAAISGLGWFVLPLCQLFPQVFHRLRQLLYLRLLFRVVLVCFVQVLLRLLKLRFCRLYLAVQLGGFVLERLALLFAGVQLRVQILHLLLKLLYLATLVSVLVLLRLQLGLQLLDKQVFFTDVLLCLRRCFLRLLLHPREFFLRIFVTLDNVLVYLLLGL